MKKFRSRTALATLLASALLGNVSAEETPTSAAQPEAGAVAEQPAQPEAPGGTEAAPGQPSLEELDQRVKIIERLRELEKEAAAEKAKTTPIVVSGKDGFSLKSPDNAYQIKFRAYTHIDGRFFAGDTERPATSTFLLRRVRPIFEATLHNFAEVRIMPDFGGGTTSLQDAYLDLKLAPWLKVRAGKFKPPVGLERLQSATDMLFVERALPTNLVPNRDVGIQLHGDAAEGVFSYAVGVFNGVVDGSSADTDTTDSKDLAARAFLTPFKTGDSALSGLSLGVAFTSGNQDGTVAAPALASYRSTGQQTFFSYLTDGSAPNTVIAAGKRQRIAPQATFYLGALGLLGEYSVSEQEVQKGDTTAKLKATSWQATGSFFLTGEKAGYRAPSPRKPFEPGKHTWGAFELVARSSVLEVDEAAFPTFADIRRSASEAQAFGAGVNWHWTKNVKLVLDYEQTSFTGGAATGDRETEKVVFTRFQFTY